MTSSTHPRSTRAVYCDVDPKDRRHWHHHDLRCVGNAGPGRNRRWTHRPRRHNRPDWRNRSERNRCNHCCRYNHHRRTGIHCFRDQFRFDLGGYFNFVIPQGPTGPIGPSGGPVGPTGPQGATGAAGTNGAAATVTVGTTTTGAPGSTASVTNSGNTSAATFNFTVPQGPTGATGQIGTVYQGTSNGATVFSNPAATWFSSVSGPCTPSTSPCDTTLVAGGTVSSLTVALSGSTAVLDGSIVFAITHNDAATTITCTIGAAASGCQDLTHSITVLAGDTLGIQMTPSASHNQTISGSWAISVPFTGAVGPTGPAGVQGPSGPTGPAGPTGAPGMVWDSTWNSGTSYSINQVVQFGGSSYISLANLNQGNTPSPSSTKWALVSASGATGATGTSFTFRGAYCRIHNLQHERRGYRRWIDLRCFGHQLRNRPGHQLGGRHERRWHGLGTDGPARSYRLDRGYRSGWTERRDRRNTDRAVQTESTELRVQLAPPARLASTGSPLLGPLVPPTT